MQALAGGRVRPVEVHRADAHGHREAVTLRLAHHPVAEELPGVVEERALRGGRLEDAADAVLSEHAHVDDALERRAVEHPAVLVHLLARERVALGVHEGRRVGRGGGRIRVGEDGARLGVALDRDGDPVLAVEARVDLGVDRRGHDEPAVRADVLEADDRLLRHELRGGLLHQLDRRRHRNDGVEIRQRLPPGGLAEEGVVPHLGKGLDGEAADERGLTWAVARARGGSLERREDVRLRARHGRNRRRELGGERPRRGLGGLRGRRSRAGGGRERSL